MPVTITADPLGALVEWEQPDAANQAGFDVQRSDDGGQTFHTIFSTPDPSVRAYHDLGVTLHQEPIPAYQLETLYGRALSNRVAIPVELPAVTPPPVATLSPEGTTMPPATQLVDKFGVWTFSGLAILLNGVPAAAGMGSSATVKNGVIVFTGTDGNGYVFSGSSWSIVSTAAPPAGAPPATTPPLVPPTSTTKRLVTKGDLRLIGTFRSPNIGAGGKFPMMTVRRNPQGVLTSFWLTGTGFFLDETCDLCECTVPDASTPGQVSTLITNYGHGYLAKMWANGLNPPDHLTRESIFWDAEQSCVVLNYSQGYSGQNDPSFVLGFIDDTAHTCTWVGPFRSGAGSKQTQGFGCLIPKAYADRYLGGKRYGLGKNGGAIDASEAFAPVIHATDRPTRTTPPSGDGILTVTAPNPAGENGPDLAFATLLGGDINHRGKRPGDYLDVACGGTGVGAVDPTEYSRTKLTGRMNVTSGVGSVAWFDWADLRGVIFLGGCARGHCWYNTPGNGFVKLSGQTGAFVYGETMTGQTSHVVKTAKGPGTSSPPQPARWNGPLEQWFDAGPSNGDFTIGEVVVGGTTGARGTVTDQHRFDHCLHGIDGSGSGITGPITEIDPVMDAGHPFGIGHKSEDFFWFYDEQTFLPVVGGGNPWDVEPTDGVYALDLDPKYAVMKDDSPAGGGAGNCMAIDEPSRLVLIACGYNVAGNPYVCDVNVFGVAP